MPDPLFFDLCRDTARLTWAPTEQVRERGRQRLRRTRVAAGVAGAVAVAVIATGAVAVAGRPDAAPPIPPATGEPTPTGTPEATPSRSGDPTPSARSSRTPSRRPTTPSTTPGQRRPPASGTAAESVPASAMLQLADLPDGFEAMEPEFEGDGSLWFLTTVFDCDSRPAVWREVSSRRVTYGSPTEVVSQRVTRHAGDGARTKMADARRLADECTSARPGDSIRVLADGLGGDEGLLMGATVDGREQRWILVRQGDLVAENPVRSLGVQITEAEARKTAQKVAARLCNGTDDC
ncbi:hypothetical protein [Micromonospora endolithica]|uniref:Uncharacterized protein n=1 Tax=Micromonospora endolithica TaxID=230091 RepID=A0A3A9ZCZ0_9ACTN|nr:hypothetical protein [Micromonospora endolithica]RKN46241.1 hypothetical protein D7223_15055 [Micromonospora endolithica]TWJ25036.1 hypothetical protein JD76_05196 [Micromonospora endolithica]